MMERLIDWTERGYVADFLLRAGIRRLLRKRLSDVDQGCCEKNQARLEELIAEFSAAPVAMVPEKANEQHYEVPPDLFRLMLGPRRKYSSCVWPEGTADLAAAEDEALRVTCERAQLEDRQSILELGCGWGSLTLWMAKHYPNAKIMAVSNSASQREFILAQAAADGIGKNLTVITADMNDFQPEVGSASNSGTFDRVVSVEMFEHMRNHQLLLQRISGWLNPTGKLFVHIFCHRCFTYKFTDDSDADWMSRNFFSGGIMPGDDLLGRYQRDLKLARRWRWSGLHYQKTCEAWLSNLDRNRTEAIKLLGDTYGQEEAFRWFNRWRMFHLACSELFGFNGGNEWWVGHYLFEK
jgi:cyclopropane-fatty-acyl-phospholipid synthase